MLVNIDSQVIHETNYPECSQSLKKGADVNPRSQHFDSLINFYSCFFFVLTRFRKATRQVIDAWLVSHATSTGSDVVCSPTHANGQNCSSRGGSGATTPVR